MDAQQTELGFSAKTKQCTDFTLLSQLQRSVINLIAQTAPLAEVFDYICQFIEQHHPDTLCQVQLNGTGVHSNSGSQQNFPIHNTNTELIGYLALTKANQKQPPELRDSLIRGACKLINIVLESDQQTCARPSEPLDIKQISNRLPGIIFNFKLSPEGKCQFSFVSQQILSLLGLQPHTVETSFGPFWQAIHPNDRSRFNHAMTESAKSGNRWEQEFRMYDSRGNLRWMRVSAEPETNVAPETEWSGIFLDVTNSKQDQEQLHLGAIAFATTNERMLITDADHTITDVNQAFCEMIAMERDNLIGKPLQLLAEHFEEILPSSSIQHQLDIFGQWKGVIWQQTDKGKNPLQLNITQARGNNGQVSSRLCVLTEVSNRPKQQGNIRYLTEHDPMTQLPNRSMFNMVLTQWLKHQPTLAVIMLDVDRFKQINDTLGHQYGDQLLIKISQRIQKEISPVDVLARVGGDEFAILLPMVSSEQEAIAIAERLIQVMEAPFNIDGRRYFSSVSIGIAQAPHHGDDTATLVKNVDIALHHIKKHSRAHYQLFTPDLLHQVEEWIRLEPELRNALSQNQFVLYYQPQINGKDGSIVGAEALIRWCHPELGMVSPARFLPIAEDVGLMEQLGAWVLDNACKQLSYWLAQGLEGFHLSVNLAGDQITSGRLINQVSELLDTYQLPPETLELEILETFVMEHEALTTPILTELRNQGVRLSLDDFGTGYSSLAYLKKLPIHKVKIDQALVKDIPDDPDDVAITRAVINLGQSLNLTVCAEGVETDGQHNFLRQEDCDLLQGYLFSKPITARALEQYLISEGRMPDNQLDQALSS